MNETHRFQVSISCWRLWNHIDEYLQNTGGMFWVYCTVAPRRQPPRYHDHFNAVFPIPWCITFWFTNATTPVSRPRPQSSCYKTANRAPRKTTTIFYRYPYAGKLVNCQQQFAQLLHVVLKRCKYRDVGVSASAVWRNKLIMETRLEFVLRHRLFPLCDFIVQVMAARKTNLNNFQSSI